jgi:enolase
MRTEGVFRPATAAEARERFEAVGPTAQTTVREVAKAMDFDRAEYGDRVTSDVVETAREVIFASLLEVHVGTDAEYEDWLADHDGYERAEIGSDSVSNVAWHAAPAAETVVAATFEDKETAAVGTLRRQAFGEVYRDIVRE